MESIAVLEVRELTMRFEQRVLFAQASLTVADGEIVEVGTPEHFFESPTEDRTKLFLSQIL